MPVGSLLPKKLAPFHPHGTADERYAPRDGETPAVSIVVPVKNEAGNIASLVAEIAAALGADATFEVIYVNDGSSDATPKSSSTR